MARPRTATREQVLAGTRQRLLDSAVAEFAREGFAGANINRISQAAGYAKGTVYNHFASKRELMVGAIDAIAAAHTQAIVEQLEGEDDPAARLESFFSAGFAFVERDPAQARVVISAIYGPDAELRDRVYEAYRPLFDLIGQSILEAGIAEGEFRPEVAPFAKDVVQEGAARFGPLVEAFQIHRATGEEAPSTQAECVYELLTLGVLWRVYAGRAASARAPLGLLQGLGRLRQRAVWLKPLVDRLRGTLSGLLLPPAGPCLPPPPALEGLDSLLGWLAAAGAFDAPAKRLRAWRRFMASLRPADVRAALAGANAYADWFEVQSALVLGHYTPHVERFLAEAHPRYRWREDALFCGRQRIEYHLGMVGTEVLNGAFRPAFLATRRKVVLLPPCMGAQPEDGCRARPTPFGARCAGCTPGCRIRELTGLGQEQGFDVLILPGELAAFSHRFMPAGGAGPGIVGVSCVLTNADGGWQARELGIPAQGVPLDYCGCSWHWHERGLATEVNEGQLLRVLGIEGPAEEV